MKHTYRVGVSIPVLSLVGDYDVDARILVVPIKGVGDFRANASRSFLARKLLPLNTQFQPTVKPKASSKQKS